MCNRIAHFHNEETPRTHDSKHMLQVLAITDGTENDDAEAQMQAMLGFTGFGGK